MALCRKCELGLNYHRTRVNRELCTRLPTKWILKCNTAGPCGQIVTPVRARIRSIVLAISPMRLPNFVSPGLQTSLCWAEFNIEPSMPRTTRRQQYRVNVPSTNPESNWQRAVLLLMISFKKWMTGSYHRRIATQPNIFSLLNYKD